MIFVNEGIGDNVIVIYFGVNMIMLFDEIII